VDRELSSLSEAKILGAIRSSHYLSRNSRKRTRVGAFAHAVGQVSEKGGPLSPCKLNCLLDTWQNALDFDVDIKLTRILLSSRYGQIDKLRRASGGRVLFSRITLLYLAKQACIACGDTGTMMNDVAELKKWCPGWESNPHEEKSPEDFKSSASAIPPPGRLAPTKSSMYEGCAQCLGQCSRQCAGSAPGQ
jgi:hypothetical protein